MSSFLAKKLDATTGQEADDCLHLYRVKVGDVVTRYLAGALKLRLAVTEVTQDIIICGDWEFDRTTGAEIDDVLDWGPPPKGTGSYIVKEDS